MKGKRATVLGSGMSAAALAADTEQSDIEYIIERQRKAREDSARKATRKRYDYVSAISAYESGELDDSATIELFDYLLRSGVIYALQGSYQRMAQALIDAGEIGHNAR